MFCRCFLPIFGKPYLPACSRRREGAFNEHHARRLPSWVRSQLGHVKLRPMHINTISLVTLFFSLSVLRTLAAGGMGTLMLDWYGWESMFYTTGFLSGLWALVVWQYFLKGAVTNVHTFGIFLLWAQSKENYVRAFLSGMAFFHRSTHLNSHSVIYYKYRMNCHDW